MGFNLDTAADVEMIEPKLVPPARQTPARSPSAVSAVMITLAVVGVLLLVAAVVAIGAALVFWKARSAGIQLQGELQPVVRHDLFAPSDCTIEAVLVKPGELVQQGQILAKLRSADLEAQHEAVLLELQSAQQQLLANREAMVFRSNADEVDRLNLVSQSRQLEQMVSSLNKRREQIAARVEELNLRSPLEGQVVASEFELLPGRPVASGQKLIRVFSVSGKWCLELRADEAELGSILMAQAATEQPLGVRYYLVTEPGVWHHGELEEIGRRPGSSTPSSQVITVQINQADIAPTLLRPGTTVQARISPRQ